MTEHNRIIAAIFATLLLAGCLSAARAQEVSIPDPGLNAAVREALHKPSGPLTEQDLLTLTNLDASRRNVKSTAGLEAARNLLSLNLQINLLTNFSIPTTLTNLSVLDLTGNPLSSFSVSSGLTNLASLTIEGCNLTNLTLPATLTGLTNLDIEGNDVRSFTLPATLTSLISLDLGFNQFTSFALPAGLTNLSTFYFAGNPLTNVTFPPGLSGLTELNLSQNLLTHFILPAGMTNLAELNLFFNQLTNLSLPADLKSLSDLDLDFNRFTSLSLPTNLARLNLLHLHANLFTNLNLPTGMTGLTYLDLRNNQLSNLTLPPDLNRLATLALTGNRFNSFILPVGLTNLVSLSLAGNLLTNLVLPSDLTHLMTLDLAGNEFTSLTLPAGLTSLTGLFLEANQLTMLTLPPDMTHLTDLSFLDNPMSTLVLSEPLAASTNLMVNLTTLASLQSQGISVFTYPLSVQLTPRAQQPMGAFRFTIAGPPGDYTVLNSTNLVAWSVLGVESNPLGHVVFTDVTANVSPRKFYRVVRQVPPANMVFIAPNTFTMGSPTNELHRQPNEGPQTTVTLTRGFWIGKYEVTQGEYVSVTGTNPSVFLHDLSSPVSNVSWLDATNYCWLLTQRERTAGPISATSEFRLPTEAEWECAARAGTTTRFSYGDDPDYASLTNYAWYSANGELTVHHVGQKLPNPWGLYDMTGNVWEWCQDWLGDLPGGSVVDPQGPPSNATGVKVARGGAYDFSETDCRSARRFSFGAHPSLSDSDIGFRVVLIIEPQ